MHAFRVRADRELRGWNSETGAQYAAAYQQTRAGRPGGAGKYTHSLDAPPDLPPGRYHEWTLVIVADQPFDIDLLETPIDARGLTTGFDRSFGPGKRGPSDQRGFDIVGFPYPAAALISAGGLRDTLRFYAAQILRIELVEFWMRQGDFFAHFVAIFIDLTVPDVIVVARIDEPLGEP